MKTRKTIRIKDVRNLSFLLLLVLTSCEAFRVKETAVKGVVYDQTTEKPIQGVVIHLYKEWENAEPFGPAYQELVATVSTDENGGFSLNEALPDRVKYSYLLKADIEGLSYFGTGAPHGSFAEPATHHFIEAGSVNHVMIPLIAYGSTRVTVINESPYNQLSFNLNTHINGIETPTLYATIDAGEIYTSEVIGKVAQGIVDYHWDIEGMEVDTTITESIEIEHGVLNEIEFTFSG
jgi:hypothetical protein